MLNVKIKNFQSIGNVSFDIDGFTVIVGKNNLGKSAIIRAIDAALTNRTGSEFIRWGKTKSEVSLKKDGLDVNWSKGDTATYKVNGHSFSKLNRSVPQPILDAGIKKIEVGDQKLNPLIAHQFEELFLLDKPGSVITDVLSVIYNLNILSDADDLCIKELKSKKSLLKVRESDQTDLKEKLEKYKDLDTIKIEMKVIQELDRKSKELSEEIKTVSQYILELTALTEETRKLQEMSKVVIPSTEKTSAELSEYVWFSQIIESLRMVLSKVRTLESASKAVIPEYRNAQNLLGQLIEIATYDVSLGIEKETVKKLETASRVTEPSYLEIQNFLEKFIELIQYSHSLENSESVVNKIGTTLKGLESIDELSKTLSLMEGKIKESSDFNVLADDFLPSVKMAKTLQAEAEKINQDIFQAEKEYAEFKICPLCEKPL